MGIESATFGTGCALLILGAALAVSIVTCAGVGAAGCCEGGGVNFDAVSTGLSASFRRVVAPD